MKKMLSMVLVLVMILTMCVSALAEEQLPDGTLYKNGRSEAVSNEHAAESPELNLPSLIYFDNLTSMLLALKSGRIGRMIVLQPMSDYICAHNSDVVMTLEQPLYARLSMAVDVHNTDLMERLNTAIHLLLENGRIDEIYADCMVNVATDPAPAELAHIEGGDTVRVAVTGDLPPLDFVSANGEPAGFNIALLSAIGEAAGINFELVVADAGSRASMLASGRVDAIFWMQTVVHKNDADTELICAESAESVALTDAYIECPRVFLSLK